MNEPWWVQVNGGQLAQGDLLPDCLLPVFVDPTPNDEVDSPRDVEVHTQRLIVVTQSCDLHKSIEFVALCPIHTLVEFEDVNPAFTKKGRWENVRKGREEGLHLLASPEAPQNNRDAIVADFGHIVSVPHAYITRHAAELGPRWRLDSPFLEHFSQAFARFFMRVGLPSSLAKFD
jgi:hypothetical protein